MAEDPLAGAAADVAPGGVSDAAGPANVSTAAAPPAPPDNSSPLPPPAPRRPRRSALPFPRPRVLPWLGLLMLIGCVAELLRTASPPGLQPSPVPAVRSRGGASTVSPSVILDAGHGGADTGAVANGLAEKDLTLDIARRVAAVLEGRGIASRLTRTDDRYVPLATRARVANALPQAIFVSIHLNHAATGASGIETFYSQQKESSIPPPLLPTSAPARLWQWVAWLGGGAAGEENETPAAETSFSPESGQVLALRIQTALVTSTSAADRGVKERALYVTRHVRAPAVLVEGGFLSHPAEARQLADPAYRQRLAESIADGVGEFLRSARRRAGPEQSRAGA